VTQPVFSFTEQDAPGSIGVIFDLGGSVKNTLGEAKVALREAFFSLSQRARKNTLDSLETTGVSRARLPPPRPGAAPL
jgi:hypothetical protein